MKERDTENHEHDERADLEDHEHVVGRRRFADADDEQGG
jgi:hypothetical protein